MKDKKKDMSLEAAELTDKILKQLEQMNHEQEIAYASVATVLIGLHLGLGKGKAEWLEMTKHMAALMKDDQA